MDERGCSSVVGMVVPNVADSLLVLLDKREEGLVCQHYFWTRDHVGSPTSFPISISALLSTPFQQWKSGASSLIGDSAAQAMPELMQLEMMIMTFCLGCVDYGYYYYRVASRVKCGIIISV